MPSSATHRVRRLTAQGLRGRGRRPASLDSSDFSMPRRCSSPAVVATANSGLAIKGWVLPAEPLPAVESLQLKLLERLLLADEGRRSALVWESSCWGACWGSGWCCCCWCCWCWCWPGTAPSRSRSAGAPGRPLATVRRGRCRRRRSRTSASASQPRRAAPGPRGVPPQRELFLVLRVSGGPQGGGGDGDGVGVGATVARGGGGAVDVGSGPGSSCSRVLCLSPTAAGRRERRRGRGREGRKGKQKQVDGGSALLVVPRLLDTARRTPRTRQAARGRAGGSAGTSYLRQAAAVPMLGLGTRPGGGWSPRGRWGADWWAVGGLAAVGGPAAACGPGARRRRCVRRCHTQQTWPQENPAAVSKKSAAFSDEPDGRRSRGGAGGRGRTKRSKQKGSTSGRTRPTGRLSVPRNPCKYRAGSAPGENDGRLSECGEIGPLTGHFLASGSRRPSRPDRDRDRAQACVLQVGSRVHINERMRGGDGRPGWRGIQFNYNTCVLLCAVDGGGGPSPLANCPLRFYFNNIIYTLDRQDGELSYVLRPPAAAGLFPVAFLQFGPTLAASMQASAARRRSLWCAEKGGNMYRYSVLRTPLRMLASGHTTLPASTTAAPSRDEPPSRSSERERQSRRVLRVGVLRVGGLRGADNQSLSVVMHCSCALGSLLASSAAAVARPSAAVASSHMAGLDLAGGCCWGPRDRRRRSGAQSGETGSLRRMECVAGSTACSCSSHYRHLRAKYWRLGQSSLGFRTVSALRVACHVGASSPR